MAKHVNIEVHGIGIGSGLEMIGNAEQYFRLFPEDEDMTVTFYPDVTLRRDGSVVPSVLVTCDDPEKVVATEQALRKAWPEIDIIIKPLIA